MNASGDQDKASSKEVRKLTRRLERSEANRRKIEEMKDKNQWLLERATEELTTQKEVLEGVAKKLSKYLSPQVYSSIFSGEKDVRLETQRKNLTVFFSDLVGFTAMTDRAEPEVVTRALNSYLTEMANIALRFGGTIDKFIGDAILVFFGDPETLGPQSDALACVRMALEMRKALGRMDAVWEKLGLAEHLKARIGIATGFCSVGNFGSEDRLDYTILGGPVNLASRLEHSAETDQILLSRETYLLVKDHVVCQDLGEREMKGMAYPIPTYAVTGLLEAQESEASRIEADHEGFHLLLDLHGSDPEVVRKTLQDTLNRLEGRA